MAVQERVLTNRWSRAGLLVTIFCAISIIFDGYDLVIYGSVVPVLLKEWHISPAQAGAIGSYALIGMMIGAFIFGPLADKWGRKTVFLICLTEFSIAMALAAMAGTPGWFGFWRFVGGLGLGGVMPNAVAMTAEFAPPHLRSTLVSMMFSGYSVGGVLAAALSIFWLPEYGWRSVFWFGAIPIVLVPLMTKLIPEGAKSPEGDLSRVQKGRISELFRREYARATVFMWIAFFMCLLMIYGLNTWLPQLMRQAGYPLGSSLTFLLVLNLFAIVGAVVGGALADKVGSKKVLVTYYLMAAVSIFLLSRPLPQFWLYVMVAVAGAGTIGTQIIANAFASTYYPREIRATGVGWALGAGRLGAILGPTIGGILLSLKANFALSFLAFSIPGCIAALSILFIPNRSK